MVRRDKDNDHTKSGQLRRRRQFRIQNEMMMISGTKNFFESLINFIIIRQHICMSLTSTPRQNPPRLRKQGHLKICQKRCGHKTPTLGWMSL